MKKVVELTRETVNKYLEDMRNRINAHKERPVSERTMHIANGNNKVPCRNCAKASGISCANCTGKCDTTCYDIKVCVRRGDSVKNARAENQSIFDDDRDLWFQNIENACTDGTRYKAFRYNEGGEIEDTDELNRLNLVAEHRPNHRIWTYTKMDELLTSWAIDTGDNWNENFSPMMSRYGLNDPIHNPLHLPEFLTLMPGEVPPAGYMECPGDCGICLDEGIGCPYHMNVYTHLHN